MAETFDPYLKWLGIRQQGHISHYRLLGLEPFENDVEVISSAAERQIRHIESFATMDHRETCNRIVAEIRSARDCLLDPQQRAEYDHALKKEASGRQPAPTIPAPEIDTGAASVDDSDGMNFDFGDTDAEVRSRKADSVAPRIKTGAKSRRRRKSPGFDWAGWVLGAIGALVFAYVLVNTDMIDRIKGRVPENDVAANANEKETLEPDESQTITSNKEPGDRSSAKRSGVEKDPTPGRTSERPPRDPSSDSSDSNANPENNLLADNNADGRPNRELPEAKEIITNNPRTGPDSSTQPASTARSKRTAATRQPVPEPELLEQALQTIRDLHKPELEGRDQQAKLILAKSLSSNFRNQHKPEMKYAVLQTVSELASEVGALDILVSATKSLERHFDIEFWQMLEAPAERTVAAARELEPIAVGLADLLDRARRDKKFMLANKLAGTAAKVARKEGDRLQQDMLVAFGKDMKSLDALRKRYDAIKAEGAKTPKEKMTQGQYVCFGLGDWEKGLPLLADGTDKTLALVAKTDLNAAQNSADPKSRVEVARAWFNLSKKSKYKGFMRRCMLERARDKLDDSNLRDFDAEKMLEAIRQHNQPVKLFMDHPHLLRSRTYVFDVGDWPTFDSASLRGGTLRLGLGSQSRLLTTRRSQGSYLATTRDGKIRFRIRLMDNGIVEMRLYDTASNRLDYILYGKAD